MAIKAAREKYLREVGDIDDAEQRFLKGQQAMLKAAADATLKSGIERHIAESEQPIQNPDQVFQLLGERAEAGPCDAAKGIVTEGQKNLKEAGTDQIRDCPIDSSLIGTLWTPDARAKTGWPGDSCGGDE